MILSKRSSWLAVGLMATALILSGCFQTAGEGVQPTQPGAGGVVPEQPTFTPQVMPTDTLAPIDFPTLTPTDLFQQTVVTPFATIFMTPEGGGLPTAQVFPTQDLSQPQGLPTTGFIQPTQPQIIPTAQVFPTQDPFAQAGISSAELTATAMIAEMLGTPIGQQVAQIPTATPTLFGIVPDQSQTQVFPPVTGPESTATAMVMGATQTVAAAQTLIATASGTYVPTATATPQPSGTATITPTPTVPGQSCVHTVARGETLYRISRRYGVTVDAIVQANGITNPSLIRPGQQLNIPNCGSTGVTPVPVTPGAPTGRTHLIRPGENLYRISLRYGVSMAALANANGITNVNYIRAGDTLVIP